MGVFFFGNIWSCIKILQWHCDKWHYGWVSVSFPINAFSLSFREEDPWWRFHYINWWFKRGWISQARLWRHHSIIPEQNDWKIPFLAEAGSDSQDKSTGMLRPKTGISCVIVMMDFGKVDPTGCSGFAQDPLFQVILLAFLFLDLHPCPQAVSTALEGSNPSSLIHVSKSSSANSSDHFVRQLTCQ